MFGDFEKHYFKEDLVSEESQASSKAPECQHVFYTVNDGTFCQRCLLQMSTSNETTEQHSFVARPTYGGIRKELEFLNLSTDIVELTNDLFLQTCEKHIHRGQFRKSIICACLFHAFLVHKCPQNFDVIKSWFGLDNHFANKGYNLVKLRVSSVLYLYENYVDTATMLLRRLQYPADRSFYDFLSSNSVKEYIESKNMKRMHLAVACFTFIFLQQKLNKSMELRDFCNVTQNNFQAVENMMRTIRSEIDF
jgi:hypothetical protein